MTEPFDWAGLWIDVNAAVWADPDRDPSVDDAAAYLRERIEAAFVPGDRYYTAVTEYAETKRALSARAEAAEARVKVLEEAIKHALNAPMIDHSDKRRGVYGILRAALGGEHDK